MNPNYVHTITHYHKLSDGSWVRTVLHNCFFKAVTNVSQMSTQATVSNTYTVRIPLEEAGAGYDVSLGDMVVLGECADEVSTASGNRAAEILRRHKPDAFMVSAFSDNTSHLVDKHYRLGG